MRGSRVCVGLVIGLVALTACGSGTRKTATAWAPAQSGLAVDVRTETFVDTRRPTPPNGDEPGLPSRTLVTTILRPAVSGSYPLIVFAHGFTGTPSDYDNLLRAWASAGYVVAAPAFPLSNGDARPAPVRDDLLNQPSDVSFVITEVLRLDDDPASPLHGQVDRLHIAAAGHSMGAATTLGVALNTCCRDNRIAAAAVLSGGDAVYPGGTYPAPDETPVLFEHGTEDESIPIGSARKAFAVAMPPKFFVTLDGASHVPPFLGTLDHPDAGVVARSTVDFFDRYLKGVPDGLTRLRHDANVSGTAHLEESVA